METRHGMTSKAGHYVESKTRAELEKLRASDSRFKYARISRSHQTWDDLIVAGTIYPPKINSRAEFRRFNIRGEL